MKDLRFLASRSELNPTRHIPRVTIKNCRFVENNEKVSVATIIAPQARLVGIELNPGPMTSSSGSIEALASSSPTFSATVLPISPQLYSDVIHTIYSFIHSDSEHLVWNRDNDKSLTANSYQRFVALAMTSKLWYNAASTMKFPSHVDINGAPLAAIQTLRLSLDTVASLRTSPLRHIVRRIRLKQVSLSQLLYQLDQIQLGACMSHLTHLQVYVQCEAGLPPTFDALTNEISLPSSLRHLSFTIFYPAAALITGVADLVSHRISSQVDILMRCFSSRADLCEHLSSLHIGLKANVSTEFAVLPQVLQPWSKLSSLRHISIVQPTMQCVDLLSTMSQLTRIDEIGMLSRFGRFVCGPNFSWHEDSAHQPRSHLPPIEFVKVQYPHAKIFELFTFLSSTLTELHIVGSQMIVPGESLLALPLLTRLALFEPAIVLDTLLESIFKCAPRVTESTITHKRLTEQEMDNFLLQMPHLKSLTIGLSYKIQSLHFLSQIHTPSLHLQELQSLASRNELDHTRHIPRVTMKHCRFVQENQLEVVTATPPQPRLIGIELNPGPSSSSSSSQKLYDDVLHSIFAFINIGVAAYFEFISPALTCKRWFEAACTMRFHHSAASYDITNFESQSYHKPLSLSTSSQDAFLTFSRLRHCVSILHLEVDIADLTFRINTISEFMPGIINLRLWVTLNPNHHLSVDETMIQLPPSLASLSVLLLLKQEFGCWLDPDENYVEDEDVIVAYARISECMTKFATGVTSLSHFRRFSLSINRKQYIPAAALEPWSRVQSLIFLSVNDPSLPCLDVIRTMHQLQRIDGIDGTDERSLPRFVYGHEGEDEGDQQDQSPLPPLRALCFDHLDVQLMNVYSRFNHLTALQLLSCCIDPGESLLVHLPQLRQLEIVAVGSVIPMDRLLFDVTHFAPHLHHFKLVNSSSTPRSSPNQLLIDLLEAMKQLQSLTIKFCAAITDLTPLLIASPPSLTYLHITNLPITKSNQLIIAQQTAMVRPPLIVQMILSFTMCGSE